MEKKIEEIEKLRIKEIEEINKKYDNIVQEIKKKHKKRKTIPKTLKNKVWDSYIGKNKGIGECFCCSKTIDSKDFECGHVQSVNTGGETILSNLRPICGVCNKSMGTENLNIFKNKYMKKSNLVLEDQLKNGIKTILDNLF